MSDNKSTNDKSDETKIKQVANWNEFKEYILKTMNADKLNPDLSDVHVLLDVDLTTLTYKSGSYSLEDDYKDYVNRGYTDWGDESIIRNSDPDPASDNKLIVVLMDKSVRNVYNFLLGSKAKITFVTSRNGCAKDPTIDQLSLLGLYNPDVLCTGWEKAKGDSFFKERYAVKKGEPKTKLKSKIGLRERLFRYFYKPKPIVVNLSTESKSIYSKPEPIVEIDYNAVANTTFFVLDDLVGNLESFQKVRGKNMKLHLIQYFPIPEKQSTQPLPEEQSTQPLPEEQSTQPLPEEQSTQSLPEEQSTQPLPEESIVNWHVLNETYK